MTCLAHALLRHCALPTREDCSHVCLVDHLFDTMASGPLRAVLVNQSKFKQRCKQCLQNFETQFCTTILHWISCIEFNWDLVCVNISLEY